MEQLKEFQEQMRTLRPADWESLPDFALYMDQVLFHMDRQVLRLDEDDSLTAAMVNNYTKTGLVPRAEGKKYNREHLAYLTAICILKRVMPSKDMDLLIQEELRDDRPVKDGYLAFRESLDVAMRATAEELQEYMDESSLADAAIHFALQSYAASLASRRYVALLREAQAQKHPGKEKRKKKEGDTPCGTM